MADAPAKADLVYGHPTPNAAVFGAAQGSLWDFVTAALGLKVDRAKLNVTGATTLGVADNHKKARLTGGTTYTVSFSAASTLGDGWLIYLRNDGTVPIKLDPSGAETIDGLAELLIHPGAAGMVYCDGTSLYSAGLRNNIEPLGQCRLVKSGSDLVLQRHKGRFLTINGVNYEIPSAGVTLVPTGNSADTLYKIYAYMNAGVMTLEQVATAHATHTDGTEIKSGDATRAFVGLARSGTSSNTWSSVATEIRSWFNRGTITADKEVTSDATVTASAAWTEFATGGTTYRGGFVCFADDIVRVAAAAIAGHSSTSVYTTFCTGVDGTTGAGTMDPQNDWDTTNHNYRKFAEQIGSFSEGWHDARILGYQTSGTFTIKGGGTTIERSRVTVTVSGG